VIPQQRPPGDGFTVADEKILREWLGAPIMLGGPVPGFRSVRAQLERLKTAGWTVAHQVPLGLQGSACPHLLVGPPGVFSVRRIGRVGAQVEVDGAAVVIDGLPVNVLRDAVFESRRIRALLVGDALCRVQVRPVLAVTGDLTTSGERQGPLILPASQVGATLHALQPELGPFEQLALARLARRDSTWL
ncbi:MAG: NERD domain-containing protein, partial [Micrococcales bacterium]|nr:NERD domain-containing protein [Micrococcales bacterium]